LCLGAAGSLSAYPLLTLTTNVNPLNGTANSGDTFPGAVVPFGMMQWSPDQPTSVSGGYVYSATTISGFGLDHISGAGCPYGGSFLFMPILGAVTVSPASSSSGKNYFATGFSHTNEVATPGYYSVEFTNGIRTELTVTTRTGFGRFTYPAGSVASLIINAGSAAQGTLNASVSINPGAQEIGGWTIESGFCNHSQPVKIYFYTVFDRPFATNGVWNAAALAPGGTNTTGAKTGIYLSFDLPNGGVVLARTAISYVSVENAKLNLATEGQLADITSTGFDTTFLAASNVWNKYLNKVQVSGGTEADTKTFYTMMYHALQAPSVVSDANGQYIGFDGLVHTNTSFTKYEFFSGWDIYRSECQLLGMIAPEVASDMAQSLVKDAEEGGAMPRWSLPSGDTGTMTGDPSTPIIAGMYAFGATNFDTVGALAAMVKGAEDPETVASNGMLQRLAERDYLNLGYLPQGMIGRDGPVSVTLEYCSADYALASYALRLGDYTNYAAAMGRAQNWRNLYNTNSGHMQLRRSTGFWPAGFVNNSDTYDGSFYSYAGYSRRAYIEGTAAQYVWMVPFNFSALINRMGGAEIVSARLDNFFTQLNAGTASAYAYLGNEPCSQTPWIYHFCGKPYKTSSVVRRAMQQLYSTSPGGIPGNDDLGSMSSWYVWAALGMYPVIPGDDVLTMHGPLFPQAIIHLNGGDIAVTGAGASGSAPYVQSLTMNGIPSNASWIRFEDLANGGTLAFTMSANPNTNWGADLSIAPPSYLDGMTTPLAQDYFWGTGLEASETRLTWTNVVDAAAYPAGGSNSVGPITASLTGPELGSGSGNSQSASNMLWYSGKALGSADNHAYLKAFDLSAVGVTISPGMNFSYWLYPQSPAKSGLVSGRNSAYVAMDLIFTDGTNLRDSGLQDQRNVGVHPANQGAALTMDVWNYVKVDLTPLAGKTVDRIDFGYHQANSSGGYRGYVDNIAFTTPAASWFPADLAQGKPTSADSQIPGNESGYANDGNVQTSWTATDAATGHWWQVDLGQPCDLTGDQVTWLTHGVSFNYIVAVSLDGVSWTPVVHKASNPSPAQTQVDMFRASGRYVRLTVTGMPSGSRAGCCDFRVFGTQMELPSVPTGLRALRRYNGSISLEWDEAAGATSYRIARSTHSGQETVIGSSSRSTFVDSGLADEATYYYQVAAVNLLGESAYSVEVKITPLLGASGSYMGAVMAAGPVAYWPLNETTGTVAYDLVGGNDGTYTGGVTLGQPGIANGGFGFPGSYAAWFDGNSGRVEIPQGPFNLTNALSIVAWVSVTNTPSHFSGVVGRGDGSWRMSVNTSGKPGGNVAHVYSDATGPSSIVSTNWRMLAYTYTGDPGIANNGRLFVDGLPVVTNTVGAFTGGSYDVWIGGSPDYGTARILSGGIAHVAVFTNTLSSAQLQSLYQIGTNAVPLIDLTPVTSANGLGLVWSGGALLQATNLAGPWTTNPAASPSLIYPTNAQMFFRVKN